MLTTAGTVRASLAGLPDDAIVFADVWTAREMQTWIDNLREAAEGNGDDCPPIDLTDESTLWRALDCVPDAWTTYGDGLSQQLNDALYREFVEGDDQ